MKVLVTSGATREPIDGVRFITNFSTGETGSFLADFLREQGHDVQIFSGVGAKSTRFVQKVVEYESFDDLDQKLRKALSCENWDAIIHLAAISDYSVDSIEVDGQRLLPKEVKKLDSSDDITLRLKRNHKIVMKLKQYALPRNPMVIAFKLTNSASYEEQLRAIHKLSLSPDVDYVVHNDFHDISSDKINRYKIFEKDRIMLESLDRHRVPVELDHWMRGPR